MSDVNKQSVSAHLSAINASIAQLVLLTSAGGGSSVDLNAVGASVACMYERYSPLSLFTT